MRLVKIKELREAAGMSQADVAVRVMCTTRTIENAESGKSVSRSTAQRIAKALRVKLADIHQRAAE